MTRINKYDLLFKKRIRALNGPSNDILIKCNYSDLIKYQNLIKRKLSKLEKKNHKIENHRNDSNQTKLNILLCKFKSKNKINIFFNKFKKFCNLMKIGEFFFHPLFNKFYSLLMKISAFLKNINKKNRRLWSNEKKGLYTYLLTTINQFLFQYKLN